MEVLLFQVPLLIFDVLLLHGKELELLLKLLVLGVEVVKAQLGPAAVGLCRLGRRGGWSRRSRILEKDVNQDFPSILLAIKDNMDLEKENLHPDNF